jgi:hypothetical protein
MISDKLLKKLTKTIPEAEMKKLSELAIIQGPDGSYYLFSKYSIRKNNGYYIVELDKIAGTKSFNVLKNAVSWCTFDKRNNIYESNRILELDNKLASVDAAILVHQRLAKKAKKLEEKLIYLAKLGEEKMEKKQILDELDSYVETSRIWQNKRFNSKSA